MAPRVSVLVATYNMAEYLPAAIESVLAQDFSDFEIVIGDNLSTDDTAEIAQELARQDGRIRYHRNKEHLTAAGNFNLCYERSDPQSEYWIMLASDDWWKPNLLSTLVGIAGNDSYLTFVHCDAQLTDADGIPLETRYSDLWRYMRIPSHGPHWAAEELFHGCYVMALATLVNRGMKQRIYPAEPLMDTSLILTPDHNLWLQLMVRGAKAFYVDETLAYYRKHSGAMTMPWNDVARLHEEVTIFGEKLAGKCPRELDPVRLEALRNRLAQLGFEYLAREKPREARRFLEQASGIHGRRRLDIHCAWTISTLPLSPRFRASMWQRAVRANVALGRAQ